MIPISLGLFLGAAAVISQGAAHDCPTVFADNRINQTIMVEAVAHGIHSITVKDIRYYFDSNFPEANNIPTGTTATKYTIFWGLPLPQSSDLGGFLYPAEYSPPRALGQVLKFPSHH